MRLLLDTQILIWHAVSPARIKPETYALIREPANRVFVSHITLFEIALKQKIGKLPTVPFPTAELERMVISSGFILLPLATAHIAAYERIPLLLQHRDPFDRLLLATALAEDIPIISADEYFPFYAPLVSVMEG